MARGRVEETAEARAVARSPWKELKIVKTLIGRRGKIDDLHPSCLVQVVDTF